MARRSKRTSVNRGTLRKMACTGCGRHARYVDSEVTARFCNNCFTRTGNYLRYEKGLELIKPLEGIRVKDIVLGADGKKYIITGREDVSGEDKYYYCKEVGTKDTVVLGDYFFVRKCEE